jgi:glutamine amidotransferase
MNGDPRWEQLDSGMLVHVDEQLSLSKRVVFPDPPKHQLTLADLTPKASASQHASVK